MLTEIQLKNLQPLLKHKKYGALVKAAIIGWKKCRPASGSFGLNITKRKFTRGKHSKGCCFLGAVCLNRKTKNDYWIKDYVEERFQILCNEFWDLSDGFETGNNTNDLFNNDSKAFKFGLKVRKALGNIIKA